MIHRFSAGVPRTGSLTGAIALLLQVTAAGQELVFVDGFEDLPASPALIINEIDSDTAGVDTLEFIELYDGGFGGTPLDGHVLVAYNGQFDSSYSLAPHISIDLDGFATDGEGYFLIGNAAVPGVDLVIQDNQLQNGPDAVALYRGEGASFPAGTPLTTVDLVDALVYDTDDADDAGLLGLLLEGQMQVNEAGRGLAQSHSIRRCPNGSGGARRTGTYIPGTPSPGAPNRCGDAALLQGLIINELDYDQPGGDTGEFIEIHNAGTMPVDLSEITIDFYDGGVAGSYAVVAPLPVHLPAGAYFTLCRTVELYPGCNQPLGVAIQDGPADAVALVYREGGVVDALGYAGTPPQPWVEGTGSTADTDADATGLSRFPNGTDSDSNADDFSLRCISPGFANLEAAVDCGVPVFPNPEAGEVLITEVMANPSAVLDLAGEWFEIFNPTGHPLDLAGCSIEDTTGSHVIAQPLVLFPGAYALLSVNADPATNGGLPAVDYEYAGITLANTGDLVQLRCPAGIIDGRTYASTTSGVSEQRGFDYGENLWCAGTIPYGNGDLGTPRAQNELCP